mmetsp:Transcript_19859/g.20165  ORF Transcript_19859/g.20165 Transcript_19859/m.20165 type:complete len:229 (-) Transcript_19859:196-882(-)
MMFVCCNEAKKLHSIDKSIISSRLTRVSELCFKTLIAKRYSAKDPCRRQFNAMLSRVQNSWSSREFSLTGPISLPATNALLRSRSRHESPSSMLSSSKSSCCSFLINSSGNETSTGGKEPSNISFECSSSTYCSIPESFPKRNPAISCTLHRSPDPKISPKTTSPKAKRGSFSPVEGVSLKNEPKLSSFLCNIFKVRSTSSDSDKSILWSLLDLIRDPIRSDRIARFL